jgi:hypothetical protein
VVVVRGDRVDIEGVLPASPGGSKNVHAITAPWSISAVLGS